MEPENIDHGDGEPGKMAEPPVFPEGIGERSALNQFEIDARTPAQDIRLIRTAIKKEWPITPQIRRIIVDQMVEIVGTDADTRVKIAAAKTLVSADGINAKRKAPPPVQAPAVNVTIQQQAQVFRHLTLEEKKLLLEMHRKRIGRGQQPEPERIPSTPKTMISAKRPTPGEAILPRAERSVGRSLAHCR